MMDKREQIKPNLSNESKDRNEKPDSTQGFDYRLFWTS